MSYLVLARKYRPQSFDALVGQEHVTQTLRNAITSGRIAHAFLFTGIRGVGKTTAARLLAKALNCQATDSPTTEPCGTCSNCAEIADSRSVDVAEIDGASNRGIDAVRELTDNVRYLPAKSRFRVYIIDEAHMVTREAFNALLKTLEEPPAHVKFVFATTAVDKFPETIVSRCQRYDFRRIPLARIQQELRRIVDAESVELTDPALFTVAREAEGSLRDAESLLERLIAFSARGETIDESRVAEVLGVADRQTLHAAAEAVLERDARRCLEIIDAVHGSGRDLERFSRDLLEHWRNLVVVKVAPDAGALRGLPEEEIAECRRQAALRPQGELQRLFRVARSGDEELAHSPYPRLVVEMTLVRLATLEPVVSVDEALDRLSELERALGRGGAAPTVVRPDAARLSSRPAEPAARPEPRPPAAEPPVRSNGGDAEPVVETRPETPPAVDAARWQEFLEFVQKKNKVALYLNLSQARLLDGSAGRLVIGAVRENTRRELGTRESVALLEELAAEFYGAAMRVRIETATEAAAPPGGRSAPEAEMLDNPAVQAAVRILGGEVREVRSRR